jgi:hypothetical protein
MGKGIVIVLSRLAPAAILVVLIGVAACGSGSSNRSSNPTSPTAPTSPAAPTPVTASGPNWSFWTGGSSSDALATLEGAFDVSGSTITAVLDPFGICFSPDTDRVRFTGTRSGSVVHLQSQALNGQIVQLTGTLSAVGDTFQGTYSINGGCGDGKSGAMTGRYVNVTGVWVGKLDTIPTVIDLQMASVPDVDGNYGLAGSVKFANTKCFPTAAITRRGRGRIWFPDIVGDTQRLELIAQVSVDLSTMFIDYTLVEGVCPELTFGSGRLVRQ